MAHIGVGRRESYTDVCGFYSRYHRFPPTKPTPNEKHPNNSQNHYRRCGSSGSRLSNLNQPLFTYIKTNSNPKSLRWFDGESNNSLDIPEQNPIQATVNVDMDTPSQFGVISSLEDEPGAKKAMSKVDRWAALAKKQEETSGSPSNNTQEAGSPETHSETATESTIGKSSRSDTPAVKKPALRLFVTPKPRVRFASPPSRDEPLTLNRLASLQSRDVSITPVREEPKPRTPERKKPRIGHTESTAHLFNNAGNLIPSIAGIDSVTERLFDKGEIMSLRPPRSNDGYYPDGEPVGGSFLMEHWNARKRKRDNEK